MYKFIIFVFGVIFLFSLSSCHSKYVVLSNGVCQNPIWNASKTKLAFFVLQKASRPPSGIGKFPDGGTSKVVYSNLALYIYELKTNKLSKVKDFKELNSEYYTPFIGNYKTKLVFNDSSVFFNIYLINWHDIDTTIQAKYSENKTYSINLDDKKMQEVDSELFFAAYKKSKEEFEFSYRKADKLLKNIACSDWGFILNDIYPQTKAEYLEYIIQGKGGFLTRDCIFEQIAPSFKKRNIKYIFESMEDRKAELYDKYKSYKENDPYRKSRSLQKYKNYVEYMEKIKKRFDKK